MLHRMSITEHPRQTASSRRGSAAVEFAVIAPLLVTILLGFIEVTRAIQVRSFLTDTARSGCRVAILPGSTTESVTNNVKAILTKNGVDANSATITVLVNNQSVDLSTAQKYDPISVKVGVPIATVNWVTPLFMPNMIVESEPLIMMHQ